MMYSMSVDNWVSPGCCNNKIQTQTSKPRVLRPRRPPVLRGPPGPPGPEGPLPPGPWSSSGLRDGPRPRGKGGGSTGPARAFAIAIPISRGRQKEVGDPRGGWVGQRPKKDQGQICFFNNFYRVFELPLPRKSRFWIFGRIFCNNFSTRFFCKTFFVVFLNSHR
jgi:hypothetical protein